MRVHSAFQSPFWVLGSLRPVPRAAAGLPPRTRKRRRTTLAALAAAPP